MRKRRNTYDNMFNYFASFLLEEIPGEGGGEYPEWKVWGRAHLDMELWREEEEEEEHVRLLWHLVVEDDGWARVAMPIMGNTKKYDKLIGGEGKLHYEWIPLQWVSEQGDTSPYRGSSISMKCSLSVG